MKKQLAFTNKGNNTRSKADFVFIPERKGSRQPQQRHWPVRSPVLLLLLPRCQAGPGPSPAAPHGPPSSQASAAPASIFPSQLRAPPQPFLPAAGFSQGWSSPGEQLGALRFPQFAPLGLLGGLLCDGDGAVPAVRSGRCRRGRILVLYTSGWASSHSEPGAGRAHPPCTSSPSPETPARIGALGPRCWGNLPEPRGDRDLGIVTLI